MFCIHCGHELPDQARFCSSCGRHVVERADEVTPAGAPAGEKPATPALADASRSQAHGPGTRVASTWSDAAYMPFPYRGGWYMQRNGEVITWDEPAKAWRLAHPTEVPFFMRRPRFSSLKTPATWLYWLFGAFIVFSVLAVIADIANARLLASGNFSVAEYNESTEYVAATKGFQYLAMLALFPLFIWWFRRAVANLYSFGAAGIRFGKGWAIGSWFIPFASLVLPVLIANQMWKASTPGLPTNRVNELWKQVGTNLWVWLWWTGFLLFAVGWQFPSQAWGDAASIEAELTAVRWLAAFDAIVAGAAAVAIVFVRLVSKRQELRNEDFDLLDAQTAGATTVPDSAAAFGPSNVPAKGW